MPRFALTAPLPARLANESLTPAAEKSTVEAFVAAAIAAPCAAVTASSTVIVSAFVAAEDPFAVKLASSAAFPSIVAVTVPVVAARMAFRSVTF